MSEHPQAPPRRVQLQRTKGWRKPDNTVNVARPSRWGNPFTATKTPNWPRWAGAAPWRVVTPDGVEWPFRMAPAIYASRDEANAAHQLAATEHAVDLFRLHTGPMGNYEPDDIEAWLAPLRGKNLACWCPLDAPCHADVLLELANGAVVGAPQ